MISLACKSLKIICCLSELWARLDTDLKEGVGSCRTCPVTPWKPFLPPQAVPLARDLQILMSLNLPGKSMRFVILGRIENEAPSCFSQPWTLSPCDNQNFGKTHSLQPNRLCSIMAMCICSGYLSKGKYGMHFFKDWKWWGWTYKIFKSASASLGCTEVQPNNLQAGLLQCSGNVKYSKD